MHNTICEKLNTLEPLLNLSTSAIRKVIPKWYGEIIPGFGGQKLYAQQIQHFLGFKNVLSSSPRLSKPAISELVEKRTKQVEPQIYQMEEAFGSWIEDHELDSPMNAYYIAEARLVLRQVVALEVLIPNPREVEIFIDDSSIFVHYLQNLIQHTEEIEQDLEQIALSMTNLAPTCGIRDDVENWWNATLKILPNHHKVAGTLARRYSDENDKTLATLQTLEIAIEKVHYSNLPWLFLDILIAQGHQGTVTDGPRDGNRDIVTHKNNDMYITQVKCHRHPPVGEQMIRSLAETCRTYKSQKGYYVTAYRFAKNAANGQWAIRDTDTTVEGQRIAEIELVDRRKLAELWPRYNIGRLASGFLNSTYWMDMQIPGHRREVNTAS